MINMKYIKPIYYKKYIYNFLYFSPSFFLTFITNYIYIYIYVLKFQYSSSLLGLTISKAPSGLYSKAEMFAYFILLSPPSHVYIPNLHKI